METNFQLCTLKTLGVFQPKISFFNAVKKACYHLATGAAWRYAAGWDLVVPQLFILLNVSYSLARLRLYNVKFQENIFVISNCLFRIEKSERIYKKLDLIQFSIS